MLRTATPGGGQLCCARQPLAEGNYAAHFFYREIRSEYIYCFKISTQPGGKQTGLDLYRNEPPGLSIIVYWSYC